MAGDSKFTLKQIGNYKFAGKTLGKGNFARVELAEHRLTGAKVAIKIIDMKTIKEDYVRRHILREALIMKKVQHANIIKLYETLKHDCLYCLVTELVNGGDLRAYVHQQKNKKITEGRARVFFRQLSSAVKHLHDNNIVHRDLKMENILLDETKTSIKIVDFGLSNSFSKGELLKTHCGSPEYAAPELFERGCLYGPSVDIWSMGVVLYAMVIGHLPFSTFHRGSIGKDELYQHAKKGLTLLHEKYLCRVSTGCRNLLSQILQPDPTKRIGLEDLAHHTWITEEGRNPLVKQPSFLVPKNIRDRVIDRVASLYSASTAETELRVDTSRHDAVCAVYNLLIDAAIKDCKAKTRPRNPTQSLTSFRSSAQSPAHKEAENKVVLKQQSCDTGMNLKKRVEAGKHNSNNNQAGSNVRKKTSKTDATERKFQVNTSSSVKIIDFTDTIKMDGRVRSPIIRKPSSAKRHPKSPLNQKSKTNTSSYSSNTQKQIRVGRQDATEESNGQDEHDLKYPLNKQLYCNDASPRIEASCKISRFPEEDKTMRRPKVEIRPSLLMPSTSRIKMACGFKVRSSGHSLKSPACVSVHSSSFLRDQDKPKHKKQSCMITAGSGAQKYQQFQMKRRSSLPCGSNRSMKSETGKGNRLKGRTQALQKGEEKKANMTSKPKKNAVSLVMAVAGRDPSRIAQSRNQRFENAFSELRRRSGFCLRMDSKRDKMKMDRKSSAVAAVKQEKSDTLLASGDENRLARKESTETESGREAAAFRLRLKDSLRLLVKSDKAKNNIKNEQQQQIINDTNSPVNHPNTTDSDNSVQNTAGDIVTSQAKTYMHFVETQRKGSLGILKTPSCSSNSEFKFSSGHEKKNLKVTFEDEVVNETVPQSSRIAKTNPSKRKTTSNKHLQDDCNSNNIVVDSPYSAKRNPNC